MFQVRLLTSPPRGLLTENLVVLTKELSDLDNGLQDLSKRVRTVLKAPAAE